MRNRWKFSIAAILVLASGVCVSSGAQIEMMTISSSPTAPSGVSAHSLNGLESMSQNAVMLSGVPTSLWTYGCSATSAGMIFGYYDRHGYSDMYTGPAYGGVAPLTNLGSTCSIIATENGFDGRTTNGHVDDYWIGMGSAGPDPWVGGTEHTWEGCTADYMGTNQWKWDNDTSGAVESNTDGATTLWSYSSNEKLYDYTPPSAYGLPQTALCHGLRLFAESRGYTVVENYTQKTDNAVASGGFSFADYIAEIDAGRPLMLQVTGHSMVGVGYDAALDRVYLHDTWDNNVHYMTWGGEYSSMAMYAVTCITLIPEPGTISLLIFGGVVSVLWRSKRRRK